MSELLRQCKRVYNTYMILCDRLSSITICWMDYQVSPPDGVILQLCHASLMRHRCWKDFSHWYMCILTRSSSCKLILTYFLTIHFGEGDIIQDNVRRALYRSQAKVLRREDEVAQNREMRRAHTTYKGLNVTISQSQTDIILINQMTTFPNNF